MDSCFTEANGNQVFLPTLHPRCRCCARYEDEKSLIPVETQQRYDIMEIEIPNSANTMPGITKDMLDAVQDGVNSIAEEYDLRLDEIVVEDVGDTMPDVPYFCRYLGEDEPKVVMVLNSGFDFSELPSVVEEGYKCGYYAGRDLKDHIIHEMAHILTMQGCKNYKEFKALSRFMRKIYCKGVSGYSDDRKNGFETIAEAFVRMRNGEKIPKLAEKMVEEYVMRWKK